MFTLVNEEPCTIMTKCQYNLLPLRQKHDIIIHVAN